MRLPDLFLGFLALYGPLLCQLTLAGRRRNSDRKVVDHVEDGLRFSGSSNETDHFKLLQLDGANLLIGARDNVFNISMDDFAVRKTIIWPASEKAVADCLMNGKSRDSCRNYIRVLAVEGPGSVLVCGTNAFRPTCRQYSLNLFGEYDQESEFEGNGITPYDPHHNSTFARDGHYIYAATVSDLSGSDPLVYRHDLDEPDQLGIRTERSDKKCLNQPAFVGSFQDLDYVYFWFREDAVQYSSCGNAMSSRVARICKRDRGGPGAAHADTWTSFLKATLNCSLPGDYPFYFEEIEAISGMVQGRYEDTQAPASLVYAVFNTPYAAIRGSAVCAFNLEEMRRVFAESPFKSQPSQNTDWKSVMNSKESDNRPGECHEDSKTLSEEDIAFAKNHPLVEESIKNHFQTPVFIHTGLTDRFTQIAVDAQVLAVDGQRYDVLFIGTDRGRIMKTVNVASSDHNLSEEDLSIKLESWLVLERRGPIRNLLIHRSSATDHNKLDWSRSEGKLVAVSDDEVRSLPLQFCHTMLTCQDCVALRDPYCAWDVNKGQCAAKSHQQWVGGNFVQDIRRGVSSRCPVHLQMPQDEEEDDVIEDNRIEHVHHDIPNEPPRIPQLNCSCEPVSDPSVHSNSVRPGGRFVQRHEPVNTRAADASTKIISSPATASLSPESTVLAIILSVIFSLLVGFVCGYACSYKQCFRKKKDPARSASFKQNLSPRVAKTSNMINAYESTPKFNGHLPPPPSEPSVSLVLSLDDGPEKLAQTEDQNYNSGTLPKDYKVKRMYL